jgi:hypothetical protein
MPQNSRFLETRTAKTVLYNTADHAGNAFFAANGAMLSILAQLNAIFTIHDQNHRTHPPSQRQNFVFV